MKKIMTALLLTATVFAVQAQNAWSIDNAHTTVIFNITHMVINDVQGSFKKFSGNVVSTKDDFTDAKIDFTIDVNSINTDNDGRDKHLKSDDFFNAEKYPNMTFKGISLKKVSGNKYVLEGDLTIRDVTKRVKFDVIYNGKVKDGKGGEKAGFKVSGKINRLDYGLKWNSMIEAGPVVGNEVRLTINLELNSK